MPVLATLFQIHRLPAWSWTRTSQALSGLAARLGASIRRIGLIARFMVVALTVAVAVASGVAWLVQVNLTDFLAQQLRERALDYASIGAADLTAADFDPPYDQAKFDSIAQRLDPHFTDLVRASQGGIIRSHIFAADGTIIYSDLKAKRGDREAALSPQLALALGGAVAEKLSSLSSPENADLKARYGQALEVYIPLVRDERVVGAYELYQDIAPVRAIVPLAWTSVFGGFGLLLACLFLVVRSAEIVIHRQQAEQALLLEAVQRERIAAEASKVEQRVLEQSERRFRCLLDNSADIIAVLDAHGALRYYSPAAERLWVSLSDARPGASLLDLVHPDDRPAMRALLQRAVTSRGAPVTGEVRVLPTTGVARDLEIVLHNLLGDASVDGVVATCHDITDRKALQVELSRLAFQDSLSALPNRACFLQMLRAAHARAVQSGERLGVMFVDLDNFKAVNDTLGHEAGDTLLTVIATRLRQSVREADTVARQGGDEFTILLERVDDVQAAIEVADRIMAGLRPPVYLGGRAIVAGASIGIAVSGPGCADPSSLLRCADIAMYRAKAEGKGRYAVFDASMAVA